MIAGQNIVCFANDWDADPTSKHQVMKVLARRNRVLWVNSIGLRRPGVTGHDAARIANKVRQFSRGPVAITSNLHVLTPLAIPFHSIPGVGVANTWLVSRYVGMWARKLGMDRFQLWTFLPTTAPLIRRLQPEKVVYYCVDEWSAFSFLDAGLMREMEARLIAQSDLVLVSAEALYASKRPLHPLTYLIPHGVDSEHFAKARCKTTDMAPELKGLPRPIVGFWGLIHEWIDLDLLRHVATRHPEWSLVLIGKVGVDCAALRRMPNVYFLGARPYASLPSFAKGFTAAMLPFKVNRLTENVNPIKLREYLAAGLPVVSTALPEARPYAGIVRIGATADDFVREMEAAVQDASDAAARRRMEAVEKDTWEARVEYISTLVEHVKHKNHAGRSKNLRIKILADFRYKRECYGYPADTVHLLRVLLSDGSSAMMLYRLSRFLSRIKLGFLGYLVSWLNKVLNGCVLGRNADFDEGFVIMHPMGVVINGAVRGGKNIVVESGVVIGATRNGIPAKAPLLGSHIFIGSGAKLLGEITIGSHVVIGANAVVVKDVPPQVTVAGVPATIIKQHNDAVSS